MNSPHDFQPIEASPPTVPPALAAPRSRPPSSFVIGLWIGLALSGVIALTRYHLTPTMAAEPPATRPSVDGFSFAPGKPTLVMVVHPLCPCSRASMHQLADIAGKWRNALAVSVVFAEPSELKTEGPDGELWKIASDISGATLLRDPDGAIARGFDAHSSGQTFLYDAAGRLWFSGGITTSRGHEGLSPGTEAINAALTAIAVNPRSTVTRVNTPVFGCPLE